MSADAYFDYYAPTIETVMVPVKVRYHDATGVVYSFVAPTVEDVEKAIVESDRKKLYESNR